MPANLTPQYIEAESKFRAAKTYPEKLKALEEMMATIPKHKGTEKLQAMLKTKMAKLKASAQSRPVVARHGPNFHIEKTGAAQVVIAGPPNSGKSQLVARLTGAEPDVGDYPYTTRAASPYMMKYENIKIQLVDTPPVVPDDIESGQVELMKTADGILLVLDLADPDSAAALETLLLKLGEKKLELYSPQVSTGPGGSPFSKKTLVAANKCDHPEARENLAFLRDFFGARFRFISVSARSGEGLEELKNEIFELIGVIRVYSKAPGKKADLADPFVLRKGSTVKDAAATVHKDFLEKLKYARVWRASVLRGQMVNRDFPLEDQDIIELHI